jgi:hypothetical protein
MRASLSTHTKEEEVTMMMDLRREHTNCTQLVLHKPAADRIHIHNRRLPGSAIEQISARFD